MFGTTESSFFAQRTTLTLLSIANKLVINFIFRLQLYFNLTDKSKKKILLPNCTFVTHTELNHPSSFKSILSLATPELYLTN